MQNMKALVGIGTVTLGIAFSGLLAIGSQFPIADTDVVVTRSDFGTAASLARPFAGAFAANRLAASDAYAQAANLADGQALELGDGVTARAVVQSLHAQHNEVVAAMPASWR